MNEKLQLGQFAELNYSEMQTVEGGGFWDVIYWILLSFIIGSPVL